MRCRWPFAATLFAAFALAIAINAPVSTAAAASSVSGAPAACVHAERAAATEVHRAALVITFGDAPATQKICVEFTESTITGLELLKRSGLQVLTGSSGNVGVCAIDGTGSTSGDCLKPCQSGPCPYWAYFQRTNGAWQFSPVGAASRAIHDGDTDGWSWGAGNGAPPDSPGAICPLPTSTATATPVPPTATPVLATAIPGEPSNTPASTAIAAATPRPATTAAAPTSPAEPPSTAASQPTTAVDASVPPAAPDAAAPATPVNAVAGVAVTPVASAGASASTIASSVAPTSTPKSGVSIVEPDAGLRNASAAQRRHGGGFDLVPIAGFGGVVLALAAVGGFVWYRRRQFDA